MASDQRSRQTKPPGVSRDPASCARYTLYRHDLKNLTPQIAVDAVSARMPPCAAIDADVFPCPWRLLRKQGLCIRKNPINQSHRQAFRPD
jgi:hypothetical protein